MLKILWRAAALRRGLRIWIEALHGVFTENGLLVNFSKTKILIFHGLSGKLPLIAV